MIRREGTVGERSEAQSEPGWVGPAHEFFPQKLSPYPNFLGRENGFLERKKAGLPEPRLFGVGRVGSSRF